jgi:HEAT repeat protein
MMLGAWPPCRKRRGAAVGVGLAFIVGSCVLPDARADVIHLKDGGQIEAESWRDAGDGIEITVGGGTVRILKAEVARIERTARDAPAGGPSSSPAAGAGVLPPPSAAPRPPAAPPTQLAPAPDAATRVQLAIAALRDADVRVRMRAHAALREMGPAARDAVPALLQAMRDPAEEHVAGQTVVAIGPPAVPLLLQLLSDRAQHGEGERVAAVRVLGRIGVATPEVVSTLVQTLSGPDRDVASAADSALEQLGPAARAAVPALSQAMRDRGYGHGALAAIGAPALPALIQALRDPSPQVRRLAAAALGRMGPVAAPAVLTLVQVVSDPDFSVGQDAGHALAAIGPAGRDAVPGLIQALRHPTPSVRWWAAQALAGIGPAARDAVPVLIERLRDPDREAREYAAGALGRIGADARSAVPALRELVAREPERTNVRQKAAQALVRIERPREVARTGLQSLAEGLKSPDAGVRLQALEQAQSPGPAAIPLLLEALRDTDLNVAMAAAKVLRAVGPREDTVALLLQMLTGSDPRGRVGATAALGSIRPVLPAVVPALVQATTDANPQVRGFAADALGWTGQEAGVPALVKTLRDPDDGVRMVAAGALGRLGPAARDAIPELRRLAGGDPHPAVRSQAELALRSIGGR